MSLIPIIHYSIELMKLEIQINVWACMVPKRALKSDLTICHAIAP